MSGAEPTTLVLLPGLDGTDVFYRPLVAALDPSIATLTLTYPDVTARYEDLLAYVRQSIAHLPECYVLASSFSGPLAVMLAMAEPGRVRGVILAATFARFPRPELRPFRFAVAWPLVWLLRTMRRIPIWFSRERADPWRRAKAETWSRVSARTLTRRVRMLFEVDVRTSLRDCTQPVLCLAFRDDDVVPEWNAQELVDRLRAATLVTLPGNHLAIWSEAHAVAREVAAFLEGPSSNVRNAATKPSAEVHAAATLRA